MEQIRNLLAHLSGPQKLMILVVAALLAAGLLGTAYWKRGGDFRPLYTSLAPEDAGAVVEKLKESGLEYRLSENGTTVLAPAAKIAELRLQMALAGLPRNGRVGFELFDKTNFGATDFTEHVNYRRALEGELERSVTALTEVEQARVHLTFPKDSVFLEARQPAKASVLVHLRPGASLAPANVLAICHLVASAVEGLAPEAVSVLDMHGNLLSRPRRVEAADGLEPSDANLEYRQRVEKDLAAKISATLEPLLGPDRYRVGVSVDCDFSSGEQSDETLDPSRSVMLTSQRTEDVGPALAAAGMPGTASNLPRPASRPAGTATGLSRRTENVTYQSSRTVRRTRLPQGTVKRLSVALLLDQEVRWEKKGAQLERVLVTPAAERTKAIRDLVAGVVNLTPERGDQLIVETLPFEATLHSEPPPPPPSPANPRTAPPPRAAEWWKQRNLLIGAGAAAAILLILGVLAGLRATKAPKRHGATATSAASLPAGADMLPAARPSMDLEKQMEAQLADQAARQQQLDAEALSSIKLPTMGGKKTEVLTRHLRESVKKDAPSSAQVLRTWLNDEG